MTALADAARRVLLLAIDAHRHQPETARWLHDQLRRLDEPLRVAIAGKVKAGKSTLLNALVGEQVAPTDAGECTRVVTWYRDGTTPRIVLHPRTGTPRPLPVRRHDGALEIDLGATPAEECERLVVDWPAQSLRTTTLIDTPGIASTSKDGLAAHGRVPRPGRRHADRGRRRRLPHAARARAGRGVPRGVPRPRRGPGDGRQRRRGAVARRRDRRRPGRRDVLGARHRRPLPRRPDGARAVPERRRRRRPARRRPAGPCGRPSTPRSPRWPARRATTWRPSCCRSTGSCGRGATPT